MKKKAEKSLMKSKNRNNLSNKEKLEGSRFRIINEKLYTSSSTDAKDFFDKSPQYFDIMHNGFINQASTWPIIPVDEVIKWLILKFPPPKIIADMGCGDAKISNSIPNKVYSFDFKARNSKVIECDMSKTPLENLSIDVIVFVLSLMGTNLNDFIKEAYRILKSNGILLIVEVSSRIDNLNEFINGIKSIGFNLIISKSLTDYFHWFEFKKSESLNQILPIELKPCIYKRR